VHLNIPAEDIRPKRKPWDPRGWRLMLANDGNQVRWGAGGENAASLTMIEAKQEQILIHHADRAGTIC
jgi:hypothetical protein